MAIMGELIKLSIMIQTIIILFVGTKMEDNKMSDYMDFEKEISKTKERMAYAEGVHDLMERLLKNEVINMNEACYDIKIAIIHECNKMYTRIK